MKRTLVFEMLMIDSVPVTDGPTYNFFDESDEDAPSITSLSEQQALRWLLNIPPFRQRFTHRLFPDAKEVKLFFDQVEPFTRNNNVPGDIDLIMVDPKRPDQPIAFECKRVKVLSRKDDVPKINNLRGIDRGIKQVNAYQSLGFCRSFLIILLLDDGRTMTTPNTMFRYNSDEKLEVIYNIPFTTDLHADVGVIYVRINQTTGKHYNHSVGLGFCIDKQAAFLEQTAEMTSKVKSILFR